MDRVNDKASRGSEVRLRALWCKATGGGGSACDKPPREKEQEKIYT